MHVLMPHHLGVEVVVLQVWVGVEVEVGVKHRRVVILTALGCYQTKTQDREQHGAQHDAVCTMIGLPVLCLLVLHMFSLLFRKIKSWKTISSCT